MNASMNASMKDERIDARTHRSMPSMNVRIDR